MPHRDPQNYSFFDWLLVTIVSLWATLSAFLQRDPLPKTHLKKLYFFIQDFVISGGTTYLVYMGCAGYGLNQGLSIFVAGFAGHKATRFSYLVEKWFEKRIGVSEEK